MRIVLETLGAIAFIVGLLAALAAAFAAGWLFLFGGDFQDLFIKLFVWITITAIVLVIAAEVRDSYHRRQKRRMLREAKNIEARRALVRERRARRAQLQSQG